MEASDETVFETSLCSILRALALDAEAQIALYEPNRCVPCLLCMSIQHWQQSVATGKRPELTSERGHALDAVVDAAATASRSHACHDNQALAQGQEFATLRNAAKKALQIWSWEPGHPDPQFLYGTAAAAERANRAQQQRRRTRKDTRRPGRPKLRYHQKLMRALGNTPVISERNVTILRQREQALGMQFPASLFELLSLEGITDCFRERTNQDELITNAEFDEWRKLELLGDPQEVGQGYLCVAVENQAVVAWYIQLDGSADPPVFHNNDQWQEDLSKTAWVRCADSFSAFVLEMMQL